MLDKAVGKEVSGRKPGKRSHRSAVRAGIVDGKLVSNISKGQKEQGIAPPQYDEAFKAGAVKLVSMASPVAVLSQRKAIGFPGAYSAVP